MINQQQYVVRPLELHMFFCRIMKEHAIFLEAGFSPANAYFSKIAGQYKEHFETALHEVVMLGNGIISQDVLSSGELVTKYTQHSEQKTQDYTGIQINQNITEMELNLHSAADPQISHELEQEVRTLNSDISTLLDGFIEFKSRVLDEVLACNMFTANYPTLLHHILHEAEMYKSSIDALEAGHNPSDNAKDTQVFWDHIMLEHAVFIRGLLDPAENELINTANNFATEYTKLMERTKAATDETIQNVTDDTLQETQRYRDFKDAGANGIGECTISSVILPLMADHVLREANYFIRLLSSRTTSP